MQLVVQGALSWDAPIRVTEGGGAVGTIQFNGVTMTDGTEYRVLVDFPLLVRAINEALKARELLTLPMGTKRPGSLKTINPAHIVSLTDYAGP